MEKQQTGFKFGKYKLEVLEILAEVSHKGRMYKLLKVRISTGEEYLSWRLYNQRGKFIKQFLFEPEVCHLLIEAMAKATLPSLLKSFPHLLRLSPESRGK